MDDDVLKLVREARLLEAAGLASERGQTHDASSLFERACDWTRAAVEALRGGDAGRALEMAARGRDKPTAEAAIAVISGNASSAWAIAQRLEARGDHAWAARLHETAGRLDDAARAWERSGEPLRAARLFEGQGKLARAIRVLEGALRKDGANAPAAVALGTLLTRLGRDEAAVRTTQRVPFDAPERREALDVLEGALRRLGFPSAAREAARERSRLEGFDPAVEHAKLHHHAELHHLAPLQHLARSGGTLESGPTTPPARLFDRYDLVREVASTPTARVLECVDARNSERVAVKLFAEQARTVDAQALRRFERDVRSLRRMAHSNIVGVRDFIPDAPAIVYAWMDGGTLDGALSNGPVAPSRAAEIACAVLSALGDAHRIGIIHRAVKPSNVLFDSAGAPRLSDFGAAHWSDATATATAGLFDALAYVSPEQREGRSTTPATDVFAVGALLHHMLTGRRPDGTARPSDTRPSLDTRHDAVLARLMSSDLAVRPGSAFEARSLILGLPWPSTVERPSDRAAIETPGAIREGSGRLEWKSGTWVDSWTGRAIERLAASDEARTRARGFAAAGHPALQTVLRIDRDGGELWLAALGGHPLHRALTPTERSRLGQALRLLHAAGVVHGRVGSDHVLVGPGEGFVTLRFTAHAETDATPDRDLLDLDGL